MTTHEIPYAYEPRPDTGVTNATIGMWLFIASEVMLFGALFSSYVLLRIGDPAWPDQRQTLNLALASFNTVILLASSASITRASGAARHEDFVGSRRWLAGTIVAGVLFLAVKALEWGGEVAVGFSPATNNFLGLYFTMTGLHAAHVLGGVVVNAAIWRQASDPENSPRLSQRVRMAALYWNFIDLIWLVLFAVLYF